MTNMNMNMGQNLSQNYAAVIAADSFAIGGNWGFVLRENPDFQQIMQILEADRNVKMFKVSNGVIVFCDVNYLGATIQQADPSFIDANVMYLQQNRQAIQTQEFQKFLTTVIQNNSIYGEQGEGYTEYNIAIYSCNNLNKLRLNGIVYPAFSLTYAEVFKEIAKLHHSVDVYMNVGGTFENLKHLIKREDYVRIASNLEISKTLNGVFLTIRVAPKH